MGLTDDQKKFVDCLGSNVLLSASAGSGKTTTMVQKLIKLITYDKVPVTNMLVLTFTKASASEMRQKLYLALTKLCSTSSDEFLLQQLDNINTADIGTIDSICRKILAKYFYAVDIDPAFVQLDDKEQKYMLSKSIDQVFDARIQSGNEAFFELYQSYLVKRSPRTLKDMVLELYNFLEVKPDREQWTNYVLNDCYNEDIDSNFVAKYLLEFYQSIVAGYTDTLAKLQTMCPPKDKAYVDYVTCRLGLVREFMNCATYLQATQAMGRELVAKPRIKTEPEFKQQIDIFHDQFGVTYKKLREVFVPFDKDAMSTTKRLVRTLFSVVADVDAHYTATKRQMGALDFADLEQLTLQILSNDAIRQQLQQQYKYIFVDEYQDINELQDQIIEALSSNNLNLIGDVKQSIYEFRQSTPRLFVEKYDNYSTGHGQVVNLNHNFRSDDNILQFVNSVFDTLITKRTLGIDYKSTSRLQSGTDATSDYNVVTASVINKTEELADKTQAEVHLIVDKIRDYISQGYTYRDIAIIMRNRGELAEALYRTLKDINVPVRVDYKADIFEFSEVQVLLSVLKLINNDNDDRALATVLLSPIGELNEQQLADIATNTSLPNFYMRAKAYDKNDQIKPKLDNVFANINMWRHYLVNHSITQCVDYILNQYDLINHYLSMPDGQEKIANIDTFKSMLSVSDNLIDVLEYCEQANGKKVDINIVPNTHNCITVTTIHSSKGLEYKCVILAGLGNTIRQEKDTYINISKTYGVGLRHVDENTREVRDVFVKSACLMDKQKSIIEEEIRLLYVALTRAKERLHLIGVYNMEQLELRVQKPIYASTTMWDLIFKSLPASERAKLFSSDSATLYEHQPCACRVQVYDEVSYDEEQIAGTDLPDADEKLLGQLNQMYAYKYPYINQQNVAIKNTVTSILTEQNDYENVVEHSAKLTIDNVPNQDSLALGTVYHLVMQNVDYFDATAKAKDIIADLVNSGKLSPAYADKIDTAQIDQAIVNVRQLLNSDTKILKEQQFIMRGKHSDFVEKGADMTVVVQGVIDLVLISGGSAIVIDFKTNRTSAKNLLNTYAKQLQLYSHALASASNVTVTNKLLYSFHLGRFVTVE